MIEGGCDKSSFEGTALIIQGTGGWSQVFSGIQIPPNYIGLTHSLLGPCGSLKHPYYHHIIGVLITDGFYAISFFFIICHVMSGLYNYFELTSLRQIIASNSNTLLRSRRFNHHTHTAWTFVRVPHHWTNGGQ